MAYRYNYRRGGGRNWNRGGRYYGRNRRYYSTQNSRAWGNMKAAKQQADQSNFTINVPSTLSARIIPNILNQTDNEGNFINMVGVYPLNIFDLLRRSSFYQSYANMYDEFKIDKIKVKLLPTEFTYTAKANTNSVNNTYKNVTVYTAWDRTGLNKDQVMLKASQYKQGDATIGNDETGNTDGLYCIIGENITTYSSSESRVINVGTNTSITRWLNPKTSQEKGQWVSTSQLKRWYTEYDTKNCRFLIDAGVANINQVQNHPMIFSGDNSVEEIGDIISPPTTEEGSTTTKGVGLQHLSNALSDNPCYLLEDTGFKFKPTLLVGIYPPTDQSAEVKFNVETEVVCTFRGLRKASVVAN